jgi:hypothetical protein
MTQSVYSGLALTGPYACILISIVAAALRRKREPMPSFRRPRGQEPQEVRPPGSGGRRSALWASERTERRPGRRRPLPIPPETIRLFECVADRTDALPIYYIRSVVELPMRRSPSPAIPRGPNIFRRTKRRELCTIIKSMPGPCPPLSLLGF